MSTRSNIAIKNSDGSVTSIYCHWDGYPDHHGRILLDHYKSESKIKRLVSLGSISSLRKFVSTSKPHTFDRPQPNVVVAYMRDRHEDPEWCMPTHYQSEREFINGDLQEWAYLFKDGKWYVMDCHCEKRDRKLVPLTMEYIEKSLEDED